MSIPTVTQPVGWMAQFMLDCAASAATVINSDYVFIGHYEWYKDQDFYKRLPRAEWEIFIGAPKGAGDCETFEGEIQSTAELFFVLPADTPSSLIALEKQIAALNQAWATNLKPWNQGGNRNPKRIVWGDIHLRRHEKPFVGSISITLATNYVLLSANIPPFNPPVAGN